MDKELYYRLKFRRDSLKKHDDTVDVFVLLDEEMEEIASKKEITEEDIIKYATQHHRDKKVPNWYNKYGKQFFEIADDYFNPPGTKNLKDNND